MQAKNQNYNRLFAAEELVHLWFAFPEDELTEADEERLLSSDESARAQRFRFDKDRREYITSRKLVRNALSHYGPLSPDAWQFQLNQYGKPAIPDSNLRFNLSNSTKLVVCLIAKNRDVGVDVEPISRAFEIARLSSEVFSPLELAQLRLLREREKLDRALSLWTLKESYIKARGMGLTLPLKEFSFIFGESGGFRLETEPCLNDNPNKWKFCLLDRAEHRIALSVESKTDPQLELWDFRPSATFPVRQPDSKHKWFPSESQPWDNSRRRPSHR